KPTFVLTPAGETVLKTIPGIAKERAENETVVPIIQNTVKLYGRDDSPSIVPEVEKIERVLPEKADADVEGVSRQESLPLGHVSFHAALLVPERIQTPVRFELKPDLLAVLRDILK